MIDIKCLIKYIELQFRIKIIQINFLIEKLSKFYSFLFKKKNILNIIFSKKFIKSSKS